MSFNLSKVDFFWGGGGGGGGRELDSKILYLTSQKEIETSPSLSVVLFSLEARVISIIFEKKRGPPERFSDEEGRGSSYSTGAVFQIPTP